MMEQIGPLVALALLLAGASALIVARVSQRRLVPVLLIWLLAPALLMALVLLIGNLLSPARDGTLSNAIFATMLVGIFVAVPWAVICALGFLAGFFLRRKWPPRGDGPAAGVSCRRFPCGSCQPAFARWQPSRRYSARRMGQWAVGEYATRR